MSFTAHITAEQHKAYGVSANRHAERERSAFSKLCEWCLSLVYANSEDEGWS